MRDGKVVKGIQFRDHRVMGNILDLARGYRDQGADELVFYDITASPEGRSVDRGWINRVAAELDIPFCVAGGIRTIHDAEEVLNFGADKISINTPALDDPDLIIQLARRFGSQCVVVSIDSREESGAWRVYRNTGDPAKMRDAGHETTQWVRDVQNRGAGEIVLNCMNRDGVRKGYDVPQLRKIRDVCAVPLIASGGAGTMQHFADVFQQARVDGALAASVFHSGEIDIRALKTFLTTQAVEVRT